MVPLAINQDPFLGKSLLGPAECPNFDFTLELD